MILLLGLCITGLFYYFFSNQIRNYSGYFYVGTYILTAIFVMLQSYHLSNQWPLFLNNYVLILFNRGVLAMATFVWVMYVGVFVKQNSFSKKMMMIRGEISIIGCILALGHNLIFGWSWIPFLIQNPFQFGTVGLVVFVLTLFAILLMLILGVTSFKKIRKLIKPKVWKRLQRLAYVFFYLMYLQVMILFWGNKEAKMVDIIIYSIIFMGYAVLRIRKVVILKKKRKSSF